MCKSEESIEYYVNSGKVRGDGVDRINSETAGDIMQRSALSLLLYFRLHNLTMLRVVDNIITGLFLSLFLSLFISAFTMDNGIIEFPAKILIGLKNKFRKKFLKNNFKCYSE